MTTFKLDIIEHTDTLYYAVDNFCGIQIIIKKNGDDSYEGKLIDREIPIRTSQGDNLKVVADYLFSELSKIIIKHMIENR